MERSLIQRQMMWTRTIQSQLQTKKTKRIGETEKRKKTTIGKGRMEKPGQKCHQGSKKLMKTGNEKSGEEKEWKQILTAPTASSRNLRPL